MYLCLGDLDKGLEDLNALIRQDPNDMRARVRRGWTYLAKKNFPSAISDLSYAIGHKAELPLAYLNLAAVYYETGDLERAFTTNAKVFLLDEPLYLIDALFQKGLLLLAMNKDEESRALYVQGRSLAEKNSDVAGLEQGIEDLMEAQRGAKVRPQTAEHILKSLKEAKTIMKPSDNAPNNTCRRLMI
jgi:tetratricopeptide (TPR) repeat protein